MLWFCLARRSPFLKQPLQDAVIFFISALVPRQHSELYIRIGLKVAIVYIRDATIRQSSTIFHNQLIFFQAKIPTFWWFQYVSNARSCSFSWSNILVNIFVYIFLGLGVLLGQNKTFNYIIARYLITSYCALGYSDGHFFTFYWCCIYQLINSSRQ